MAAIHDFKKRHCAIPMASKITCKLNLITKNVDILPLRLRISTSVQGIVN